jgi:hypothetical protein
MFLRPYIPKLASHSPLLPGEPAHDLSAISMEFRIYNRDLQVSYRAYQ